MGSSKGREGSFKAAGQKPSLHSVNHLSRTPISSWCNHSLVNDPERSRISSGCGPRDVSCSPFPTRPPWQPWLRSPSSFLGILHLKVQIIMQSATRIKRRLTPRTCIPAAQILLHAQFPPTPSTQHDGRNASFAPRPHLRLVARQRLVTADAGIVLPAALVLDGNHVAVRAPVRTLCDRCDIHAVYDGRFRVRVCVALCCCWRCGHHGRAVGLTCRGDARRLQQL